MILQYQHNDTPVPNMRYSSTRRQKLQYQIAYTKKDTDVRFDRMKNCGITEDAPASKDVPHTQ